MRIQILFLCNKDKHLITHFIDEFGNHILTSAVTEDQGIFMFFVTRDVASDIYAVIIAPDLIRLLILDIIENDTGRSGCLIKKRAVKEQDRHIAVLKIHDKVSQSVPVNIAFSSVTIYLHPVILAITQHLYIFQTDIIFPYSGIIFINSAVSCGEHKSRQC